MNELATLTAEERSDFEKHERLIAKHLQTFYDVGHALAEIRDRRLYRANFGTFEDYCQKRWGFSRQRAAQLISGADIAENLSTVVDKKELLEVHVRELAKVPPEEQRIAYQLAHELTEGDVTASAVRQIAAVASGIIASGYVEVGEGIQKQWTDCSPEEKRALFQANLEEQTFEAMMQKRAGRKSLTQQMNDPLIEYIRLKRQQFKDLCELAKQADTEQLEAYRRTWKHPL